MKPFFETTCDKCGVIDEAQFIEGNVHIKQVCNSCGAYVKFFSRSLLIPMKEIKIRIFEITNGDLQKIEEVKKRINFPSKENHYLYNASLLYWELYLEIIKEYKVFNY